MKLAVATSGQFGLLRVIGIHGQPETESRTLPVFTFGFDFAAVMVDDKVTGHEVDAVFHRAIGADDKGIEDQS